jgi:hypothetical protein
MVSGRREKKRGNTNGPVPSDARCVSYSDGALGPEARVSRNSAKARRTIMPRFAFSPVWPSSRSIYRSNSANRSTGIRRLTMVEGGPGGRPALCCEAVSALDGCRLLSWVGLGCRGAAGMMDSFCTGLSGIATAIILHKMIYVV